MTKTVHETDVVVVGGGPAGLAAAVAAAKNGAKVALLERYAAARRPRRGRDGARARRHVQ